jgi:hypothetical protein
MSKFKLAFTLMLGEPKVHITLTNNASFDMTLTINETKDYLVPYEGPVVETEDIY